MGKRLSRIVPEHNYITCDIPGRHWGRTRDFIQSALSLNLLRVSSGSISNSQEICPTRMRYISWVSRNLTADVPLDDSKRENKYRYPFYSTLPDGDV